MKKLAQHIINFIKWIGWKWWIVILLWIAIEIIAFTYYFRANPERYEIPPVNEDAWRGWRD